MGKFETYDKKELVGKYIMWNDGSNSPQYVLMGKVKSVDKEHVRLLPFIKRSKENFDFNVASCSQTLYVDGEVLKGVKIIDKEQFDKAMEIMIKLYRTQEDLGQCVRGIYYSN